MIKISLNGKIVGDYQEEQIASLLLAGAIDKDAIYWRDGMSEWKPISELEVQQLTHAQDILQPPPLPIDESSEAVNTALGCFWMIGKIILIIMAVTFVIGLIAGLTSTFWK